MFDQIYGSWRVIQFDKMEGIFACLDKDVLDKIKKGMILDAGAGYGYLKDFLEGKNIRNVISIEPDVKMIRNRTDFLLAKAEHMPFKNRSFDVIFIIDTIHLIDFLDIACLKDNGLVIIACFCNQENQEEKEDMILSKIPNFTIVKEFVINSKEREIVIVAKKK